MEARARSTRSTFTRSVAISVEIAASPARVWGLLTDAEGFPAWNTTVSSIEGPIAVGRKLAIRVPVSDRTFTPTVAEFDAPRRMVWRDGWAPFFTGVRTFELVPTSVGTSFTMTERFAGVMVPLAARSLPDFVPIFETYAADLTAAAEGD